MIKVYAVKDDLCGFMNPIYCQNDNLARRAFANAARSKEPNNINTNPDEKSLYYLADFDEDTGVFTQPSSPVYLCRAIDFIEVSYDVQKS